jgi:hypothetical protein
MEELLTYLSLIRHGSRKKRSFKILRYRGNVFAEFYLATIGGYTLLCLFLAPVVWYTYRNTE